VLVVGGGPAGAATAIGLARAGHRVMLLEKRAQPRHKSCGDLLTPRAVGELAALDVDLTAIDPPAHRIDGVRLVDARSARGRQARRGRRRIDGSDSDAAHRPAATDPAAIEVDWPSHPDLGTIGYAVRRNVLDQHLRQAANAAGAMVLMGHEATSPLIDRGFVRGAEVDIVGDDGATIGHRTISTRFVVVADGANSAFGRSLGTTRQRRWPYGIATRTYFTSPRHGEHRMETALSLPGPNGHPISGYGWVVPLGDGTVNVGIGVSSASRDVIGVNALRLLGRFAAEIAPRWEFDADAPLKDPTRLRLPLGGSVGPVMGPTFLVVGRRRRLGQSARR
jgi:flavin-dependent dehydrogenase